MACCGTWDCPLCEEGCWKLILFSFQTEYHPAPDHSVRAPFRRARWQKRHYNNPRSFQRVSPQVPPVHRSHRCFWNARWHSDRGTGEVWMFSGCLKIETIGVWWASLMFAKHNAWVQESKDSDKRRERKAESKTVVKSTHTNGVEK